MPQQSQPTTPKPETPLSASSPSMDKETTTETPENNTAPTTPAPDLPVEKIELPLREYATEDKPIPATPVPESEPETIIETSQTESTPPSHSAKATEDVPPPSFIQTLLIKARAKIQERKQKKLGKILELLETKPQITNQDVQKLLRISRATSFRYLDILEKQNKIKQVGNTGKWVFYSKT